MKRWMSMILALCMVVLLFPTSSATAVHSRRVLRRWRSE